MSSRGTAVDNVTHKRQLVTTSDADTSLVGSAMPRGAGDRFLLIKDSDVQLLEGGRINRVTLSFLRLVQCGDSNLLVPVVPPTFGTLNVKRQP